MIVATVVSGSTWCLVGKLIPANKIAAADFKSVHDKVSSDLVDGSFNHEIGGRLNKAAHRHLPRFVGGN